MSETATLCSTIEWIKALSPAVVTLIIAYFGYQAYKQQYRWRKKAESYEKVVNKLVKLRESSFNILNTDNKEREIERRGENYINELLEFINVVDVESLYMDKDFYDLLMTFAKEFKEVSTTNGPLKEKIEKINMLLISSHVEIINQGRKSLGIIR